MADKFHNRIIVLSVASGSVLQVIQGRGHWGNEGIGQMEWVVDPGVTVYGPDIRYKDDDPLTGETSGLLLQEFRSLKLGQPHHLCWHENTKSLIVQYEAGSILDKQNHIACFKIAV